MISSLSIVFLFTCYMYFKQHYTRLFDGKIDLADEKKAMISKLNKKITTFLIAIGVIVILYAASFVLINLYPSLDGIKSGRRIADVATVALAIGLFFNDKKELDQISV